MGSWRSLERDVYNTIIHKLESYLVALVIDMDEKCNKFCFNIYKILTNLRDLAIWTLPNRLIAELIKNDSRHFLSGEY